jgi:hypothetical protein
MEVFSPIFNFLFLRFSRNVSEACAWELTLYLILIFFHFEQIFFCLDDLFLHVEVLGVCGWMSDCFRLQPSPPRGDRSPVETDPTFGVYSLLHRRSRNAEKEKR